MNARASDMHDRPQRDGTVLVRLTAAERRAAGLAVGVIVGLLATGVIAAIADHSRLGIVATKLDTVIENQRAADAEREKIRDRLRDIEVREGPVGQG